MFHFNAIGHEKFLYLHEANNWYIFGARITIECVFGHMESRWKILNLMFSGEETSRLVIKCCVHLHNC